MKIHIREWDKIPLSLHFTPIYPILAGEPECLPTYINQYLSLIHNHNTKKAISYSRTREGIEMLDKYISDRPNTISQLQLLEKDSIDAWQFLLKILRENQDGINSEELKKIADESLAL